MNKVGMDKEVVKKGASYRKSSKHPLRTKYVKNNLHIAVMQYLTYITPFTLCEKRKEPTLHFPHLFFELDQSWRKGAPWQFRGRISLPAQILLSAYVNRKSNNANALENAQ